MPIIQFHAMPVSVVKKQLSESQMRKQRVLEMLECEIAKNRAKLWKEFEPVYQQQLARKNRLESAGVIISEFEYIQKP